MRALVKGRQRLAGRPAPPVVGRVGRRSAVVVVVSVGLASVSGLGRPEGDNGRVGRAAAVVAAACANAGTALPSDGPAIADAGVGGRASWL